MGAAHAWGEGVGSRMSLRPVRGRRGPSGLTARYGGVTVPGPPRRQRMAYVDGFLVPVPKKNIDAYRRMSKKVSRVWMDHGALEYRECVGDDMDIKGTVAFPKQLKTKPGETVVFAWIVYKSKAHRDSVNAKVMKDPRTAAMGLGPMPFDCKRMCYGGFKV